ncbi:RNA-guided endonuclease InsQ/TnpB family protein [Lentzea terrae]|uniref:RNA-guided endonuclease InsQ/TnpB family protein n=1 Tax=Lentzea terrae TaxID=2200761 RepID=UPI0018E4F645|nr:zinc ribbon domain-containing protein [Lentzea terrae]
MRPDPVGQLLTGWRATAAKGLARYQRMMARRRPAKGRPGSKGYKHARRQAAKVQKKVARRRQDTARKWAKRVVRDHDVLAVEDFRPKFLAKSTMARKHGRDVRLVDPKHTTMDCAACGARTKHALPLSERTYTCTSCGAVSPRDKNSAAVMLVRAGLNPVGDEGHKTCSSAGRTGSLSRKSHIARAGQGAFNP